MKDLLTTLIGIAHTVSLTITVGRLRRGLRQLIIAVFVQLIKEVLTSFEGFLPPTLLEVTIPNHVLLLSLRRTTIVTLRSIIKR